MRLTFFASVDKVGKNQILNYPSLDFFALSVVGNFRVNYMIVAYVTTVTEYGLKMIIERNFKL